MLKKTLNCQEARKEKEGEAGSAKEERRRHQ
jgi:hypothetical protein